MTNDPTYLTMMKLLKLAALKVMMLDWEVGDLMIMDDLEFH